MRVRLKFFFIVILCGWISVSAAQEIPQLFPKEELKGFKKTAPIIVNGDKVEYKHSENKIEATGNVSVTYGDVELTCDTITVYTDKKIGICDGNVKIVQAGNTLTGQRVEYNFGEKTGMLLDGEVRAYPIYGHADKVEKVSDKKVVLDKGYITTCDLEEPHYRVSAKKVVFYLDDKVIIKNAFLYIGKVPVLYIPYYVQPIRDTKTKITLIPGYSDEWGYYVLGAYRYYWAEQFKGYLRLDYRNKRGLGGGVDNHYNLKELGKGVVRYYYTQENNALAMAPSGDVDDRYRIQYKHAISFDDRTSGTVELNKVSDHEMIKDYFFKELEDGWDADNYISIITQQPNYSFEVLTRKRLDSFFTVTERLPEVSIKAFNQRLWDTHFYYRNDMSATNFIKRYAAVEDKENEESIRFDTYNRLSYAAKVFRFLYATPYIATRQTFYSENRWGDHNVAREIYEVGIDFNTKFYKTFVVDWEKLDVTDIRHVIGPTVGFYHRHQPTVSPSNLYQFDSIDALDYENLIALGLENKLQTKRKDGEEWKTVDLLRLFVTTEYMYRFKKGNLDFKGVGKFGDVKCDLELRPYDWLFLKTDITFDFQNETFNDPVKSATTDVVWDQGEKFNLGIGHVFENSAEGSASQFTMQTYYKINEDWGVRIYERFDTYKQIWEEQEYTIFKDLHCWLAEITFNVNEGVAFWVVFRLKAFPEMPIGFQRTYRRPSPEIS